MNLSMKTAAFCRELGDTALAGMASQENMEVVFQRAQQSLSSGQVGPELEADLDALDAMVRRLAGQGMYPSPRRVAYPGPLPGTGESSGAQWWTCPQGWCAGRGRVKPGQDPPTCAVVRERLVAGPLPA